MLSSNRSVKLRSLALWPSVLTLVAGVGLGAALSGCIIVSDDDVYDDGSSYVDPGPVLDEPIQVAIDTGATLEATPGDGVGMFVEYAGEGRWRVWTACDTKTSEVACAWDAFVTTLDGSEIENLASEDIEGHDIVEQNSRGDTIHLFATTSTDFDGMTFETKPGTRIQLEMYLDGLSQPRFVYWIGDAVLHEGAPTNPLDLKPSVP
uniref:Lipoprotein n=1 Tax=Phaselicystis flava TaxID=525924 RepID=A0A3S5GYH2_9BACT|nr:hypothetical protein [Phaselicystis flava]